MADNLITTDHNLPVQASKMTVTASGNGVAAGVVQGNININDAHIDFASEQALAMIAKMVGTKMESHAAEWALLNTDIFNVFVIENERYDCGAFCIDRKTALQKNTIARYRNHFKPLTPALISELLAMPCLFASRNQNFKTALPYYPAFVGKLTEIVCQGNTIKFKFITCGQFYQQYINENIHTFGLLSTSVRNQLDEEHWCIRQGNLLQIAANVGIEIR